MAKAHQRLFWRPAGTPYDTSGTPRNIVGQVGRRIKADRHERHWIAVTQPADVPKLPAKVALPPHLLRPHVDEVHAMVAYRHGYDPQRGNPLSKMLRGMKEPGGVGHLEPAGRLLAHFVTEHLGPVFRARIDLIAPVPTTPSR